MATSTVLSYPVGGPTDDTVSSVTSGVSGSVGAWTFQAYQVSQPLISGPLRHVLDVLIRDLPSHAATVRQPFTVVIEPLEGMYLVTSPISKVYELGETPASTVRAYLDALVEHLAWLEHDESILAAPLVEELQLLRRYVQR